MGIVASLSRVQKDKFEEMKKAKKHPTKEFATNSVYIDKSWEIISFILVGKLGPRENIYSEVIYPKEQLVYFQDKNYTEAINFSYPKRVKEINEEIQKISENDFRKLFEDRDFNKYKIYPGNWTKSIEDYKYIFDSFKRIKELFENASKSNEYVITGIS